MSTSEILEDKWSTFFETCTAVVITSRKNGRDTNGVEGRELPLRVITTDLKARNNTVLITIGGRGDDLLAH